MFESVYASYDLHTHTYWSYDACAPVEYYFRRARALRLRCFAITEHFTMDSMPEILEVSRRYSDVRFIPGVEMTVRTPLGYSADFVCLGVPVPPPPEVEGLFERYRQWQRAAGQALSEGMKALGYEYGESERLALLRTYRPQKVIDRQGVTHVQGSVVQKRYFLEKGFANNEADYKEVLKRASAKVARPPYPDADSVLPLLRKAGALIFAAHPALLFKTEETKRLDELREVVAFDGVECAHDSIPATLTPMYRAYCRERGLLSSAGSDAHADPAHNPYGIAAQHEFARHIGQDEWLDEILQRLRATH